MRTRIAGKRLTTQRLERPVWRLPGADFARPPPRSACAPPRPRPDRPATACPPPDRRAEPQPCPSLTTTMPPCIPITVLAASASSDRVVAIQDQIVGIVRIGGGEGPAPAFPALDNGKLRLGIVATVPVHDRHHDSGSAGTTAKPSRTSTSDLAPGIEARALDGLDQCVPVGDTGHADAEIVGGQRRQPSSCFQAAAAFPQAGTISLPPCATWRPPV